MLTNILVFLLIKAVSSQMLWNEYLSLFPNIEIYADSQFHFMKNMEYISTHSVNFTLGVTPFMHMSNSQFSSRFFNISSERVRNDRVLGTNTAPESKDWVSNGCVTGVKDQGQCGSCWSFSTSGVMEGAHCVKTGGLVSLSEQQLVSCANKVNQGCNGGNVDWTFRYLEKHQHCTEQDYPYVSGDGKVPECHECKGAVSVVSEFVDVPKGNEDQLLNALLLNPIAVAIEADSKEFQLYKGGIMDFNCGNKLDHAVLLVGYGVENGIKYWKVKNSWSTAWGENGYFRLVRGKNICGIADSASYPLLR